MSFPNIPNITPDITIDKNDAIVLLLSSIAMEELSLSHIMNAEAEKIQSVLGTLAGQTVKNPSINDLVKINRLVQRTLSTVIKNEMLLQFKLEDTIDLMEEGEET